MVLVTLYAVLQEGDLLLEQLRFGLIDKAAEDLIEDGSELVVCQLLGRTVGYHGQQVVDVLQDVEVIDKVDHQVVQGQLDNVEFMRQLRYNFEDAAHHLAAGELEREH